MRVLRRLWARRSVYGQLIIAMRPYKMAMEIMMNPMNGLSAFFIMDKLGFMMDFRRNNDSAK